MHNCVHDWALTVLNKKIDAIFYWYAFECISGSLNDENGDDFAKLSYSPLAAHADRLVQQRFCKNDAMYRIAPHRLNQASLIATLLRSQVLLPSAEQMYQRALAGYEKALGAGHTSTLYIINNLGVVYQDQGKLDHAEQMYQRAQSGYEKSLGEDHMSTLHILITLELYIGTKASWTRRSRCTKRL